MTFRKSHNFDFINTKKFILIVLGLAFITRIGIAFSFKDSFFERGNRASSISHIAQNIINFQEFSVVKGSPTGDNEPFYTLFVAFAYYLLGTNWFSIALLQSLLNLVNAILIYYITKLVFNSQKIALISLVFFCFYPFYITQSMSISDTVFFCFCLALSSYLIILVSQNPKTSLFLMAGISWGATLLTRFSAISLFPFALVYIFLQTDFKNALKGISILILFCVLTLSPWLYRNYKLTGKFFITTHGAIELWFGYNDDTFDVISNDISVDIMRRDIEKKIPAMKDVRAKEYDNSILREVAESEIFLESAFVFALSHPWECLKMAPTKFWKFWSWNKTPVTNSLKFSRSFISRLWDRIYTLAYLPILILGVTGIYLTRRVFLKHSIFILYFIGYSALHTLVYGFSRLRVPIDQFLMIYAAYTIVYFLSKSSLVKQT